MSLTTQPVSPKATPLPPPPAEDPFTSAQWETLLAICDAIIPSIKPFAVANTQTEAAVPDAEYSTAVNKLKTLAPDENQHGELVREYLEESASQNPAFRDSLHRMFGVHMPPSTGKELAFVLNVLDTRAGSLLFTGSFTPISKQPLDVRADILHRWAIARTPVFRQLFRSLTVLTKQVWIKVTPTLPQIIGFPRTPIGMIPGQGFDYEFIQFPPGEEPEEIETDVIIVGSGCGAGVCAKNIAEAGNRVIVTEKAYHWTPEHLPMDGLNGTDHLFMNGGAISSDDTTVVIVAGQAFGGGGTVNWSASLQLQAFVRKEWADSGLPFFTSAEFQKSLDRVCDRMGVSAEHIQHNKTNALLMEGARRLGSSYKAVPQNTGGAHHNCGHCSFGCGSCEKQGPVVSYLPDAAKAGAKFIEGFHAERIIFSSKGSDKVATGVEGTWISRDVNGGVAGDPLVQRKVIIKAKRIIVSGGTMQSPLLLLRSGVNNKHIGRNLHVHPVSLLGAIHKEDINPWEGPILTSAVSDLENLDGEGHGVKLEATNMMPSSWLVWLNWKNGLDFKLNAARMKHMVGYISLAREKYTGQVYPDPEDGSVRFKYTVSKLEKKHILEGLLALAKIQYAAGAQEIFTVIPGVSTFIRDPEVSSDNGINDPKFQAWLDEIRQAGFPSPDSMFVSAHQMGTCRMSASAGKGVVDPQGRVWGTEGLYVADASVFPSASGVNPMITNMGIADWISRGIARGLADRARL